jgi:hypothetical protein
VLEGNDFTCDGVLRAATLVVAVGEKTEKRRGRAAIVLEGEKKVPLRFVRFFRRC